MLTGINKSIIKQSHDKSIIKLSNNFYIQNIEPDVFDKNFLFITRICLS